MLRWWLSRQGHATEVPGSWCRGAWPRCRDEISRLQLALTHGLGLVGVGAPAAARAFLAETSSAQTPGKIVIVIPALDLADLLGLRSAAALPELPIGLQGNDQPR